EGGGGAAPVPCTSISTPPMGPSPYQGEARWGCRPIRSTAIRPQASWLSHLNRATGSKLIPAPNPIAYLLPIPANTQPRRRVGRGGREEGRLFTRVEARQPDLQ